MRSFSMDAIQQAAVLATPSKAIPKKELEGFVGQGYGIFSGSTVNWAKLRFSKERSRWVSRELWHPQQKLTEQSDGSLILEVPFTDIRELSMDVLRQGRHVEVLEPKALRDEVMSELKAALQTYKHYPHGLQPGDEQSGKNERNRSQAEYGVLSARGHCGAVESKGTEPRETLCHTLASMRFHHTRGRAGLVTNLFAGRRGLTTNSPPQFGHMPIRTVSAPQRRNIRQAENRMSADSAAPLRYQQLRRIPLRVASHWQSMEVPTRCG